MTRPAGSAEIAGHALWVRRRTTHPQDHRRQGRMPTYLRFTRQEYRAIARVYDSLDAGGDLAAFKTLLVLSLSPCLPALAERIGRLRQSHVRVIYDHLQGERLPRERPGQGAAVGDVGHGSHLTAEEEEI